jgi:aspartokinase-like uncharacterized kinase
MVQPLCVVKLGGSLFDLPDLGPRLRAWLGRHASPPTLLVPGGGPTGDVVRGWDRDHGLGEEAAHWLALRALTLNAHLLTALLAPSARVIPRWEDAEGCWREGTVAVLDAHAFAAADEARAGRLPHRWSVTSDSVAARVALVAGAGQLVLLKSVTIAPGRPWAEASRQGQVDPFFPELAEGLRSVRAVNFREWRP